MSGKKVFIGNLSYKTKEADLIDAFKQCGKVVDAKIVRKMNGLSKGFGFVEYEKEEDARKAVEELDKIEIFDRPINVQVSTSSGEKTSNFNDDGEGDGDGDGDDYVPQKRSPKFEQRPARRYNDQGYGNDNRRPRSNMSNYRSGNNNSSFRSGNNSNYRSGNNSSFRSGNNSNRRTYTLTRGEGDRRDGDRRDNGRRYNQNRRQGRRNNNRNYQVSEKKSIDDENVQKVESKSTVFVANLPFSFQDEDLVELFKGCGEIKTAHVVRTEYRSRGYGFVEFENKEGQEDALKKMNDFPVKVDNGEDRKLIVKISVNIEDE